MPPTKCVYDIKEGQWVNSFHLQLCTHLFRTWRELNFHILVVHLITKHDRVTKLQNVVCICWRGIGKVKSGTEVAGS